MYDVYQKNKPTERLGARTAGFELASLTPAKRAAKAAAQPPLGT